MYMKKNLDYKPHYSEQIATRTLCKYSMWERMEVRTFGVCLLKSRETTCGIRCSEGELSVLSLNYSMEPVRKNFYMVMIYSLQSI